MEMYQVAEDGTGENKAATDQIWDAMNNTYKAPVCKPAGGLSLDTTPAGHSGQSLAVVPNTITCQVQNRTNSAATQPATIYTGGTVLERNWIINYFAKSWNRFNIESPEEGKKVTTNYTVYNPGWTWDKTEDWSGLSGSGTTKPPKVHILTGCLEGENQCREGGTNGFVFNDATSVGDYISSSPAVFV